MVHAFLTFIPFSSFSASLGLSQKSGASVSASSLFISAFLAS